MKKFREIASDVLTVAGAAAVAVGVSLIYIPAGIIVAGAAAVLIGWAISGGGEDP